MTMSDTPRLPELARCSTADARPLAAAPAGVHWLAAACLCLSLAACGDDAGEDTDSQDMDASTAGQGGDTGDAGMGAPDGGDACGELLDVDDADACALEGDYALLHVTTAIVPTLNSEQTARAVYLAQYTTAASGALEASETMCDLRVTDPSATANVVFPRAYVDALAERPLSRTGEVREEDDTCHYTLDRHYSLRGVDLDDPEEDALPEAGDPRIEDWDDDGAPGLTFLVSGAIEGQLHVIQRDWTELEGERTAPGRFEGALQWYSEKVYVGAEPESLQSVIPQEQPAPDADAHGFELVRVKQGTTCAELRACRAALFTR